MIELIIIASFVGAIACREVPSDVAHAIRGETSPRQLRKSAKEENVRIRLQQRQQRLDLARERWTHYQAAASEQEHPFRAYAAAVWTDSFRTAKRWHDSSVQKRAARRADRARNGPGPAEAFLRNATARHRAKLAERWNAAWIRADGAFNRPNRDRPEEEQPVDDPDVVDAEWWEDRAEMPHEPRTSTDASDPSVPDVADTNLAENTIPKPIPENPPAHPVTATRLPPSPQTTTSSDNNFAAHPVKPPQNDSNPATEEPGMSNPPTRVPTGGPPKSDIGPNPAKNIDRDVEDLEAALKLLSAAENLIPSLGESFGRLGEQLRKAQTTGAAVDKHLPHIADLLVDLRSSVQRLRKELDAYAKVKDAYQDSGGHAPNKEFLTGQRPKKKSARPGP